MSHSHSHCCKVDGSLRFWVNCWKLNSFTIRIKARVHRLFTLIINILHTPCKLRLLVDRYLQRSRSRWNRLCFTSWALQIATIPFGGHKAPCSFHRTMDVILSLIKYNFALVHLDRIIIYSWNADEHILHVRPVLPTFHKAGVALNFKTFKYFKKKIDKVGHVRQPGKLEMADHSTDVLRTSKKHVTSQSLSS